MVGKKRDEEFGRAKGGFYSERAGEFVISPNRQSKWLKSCQIGT